MPYTMNDINQPDDDKAARYDSSTFDPNDRHKLKLAQKEIDSLSQRVQARIDPVMSAASRTTLEALENEFPNLISETNILVEQVKKLSTFKTASYKALFKKAYKSVPDGDLKVNPKKNKKLFYALAKALDNTDILDAYPHEATSFKVAVLYKLFLEQDPPPIVIERLMAIRQHDLPDRFKYIKKNGISLEANIFELAKQTHFEITHSHDEMSKQRFEASYEKFKDIYLGLITPKKVDLDAFQFNENSVPKTPNNSLLEEVTDQELPQKTDPKSLAKPSNRLEADIFELAKQTYLERTHGNDEISRQCFEASYEKFKEIYLGLITPKKVDLDASQINESGLPKTLNNSLLEEVTNQELPQKTDPKSLAKPSNRSYYFFTGNELTTLEFLIPEHQKNFFIPAIGGIALDIIMRTSLSKKISIVNKPNDTRERTARQRYNVKGQEIFSKARVTMDSALKSEVVDAHDGYSGYSSDPIVINKELNKELEIYKKELVIIEDCNLSGSQLTDAYFERAIKTLENALTHELSDISKKYQQSKIKTSIFDKIKLKSEYKKNQQDLKDKYHLDILEMKNFKEIVERLDPKNMMIFASAAGGKASFSVLKNSLINDGIASAGFSAIASR